ncbi:choice-of-anchor L domain-containing protein, partial [Ichthyenterobacterium sp. W332]
MKIRISLFILLLPFLSFAQDLNMTDGTFERCAPDMFYDSGGPTGNYGDDENFVITICPENPDDFIILNFTEFSTQLNSDIITIYNGTDTSGQVFGSYSGVAGPGVIQASDDPADSGCITIEFISNGMSTTTGWAAEILCASPCQTITPTIDSTIPAASSGIISILPGETVDFNGSATFSEDGTGATYNWDFGDTNTATGQSVSNTFANEGVYTVTFEVTDTNPQGCSETATITVNVLGPYVQVDQDTFTSEQLIEDVLVNSECAQVSNIVASTGTDFGSTNGIGYFFGDGMSFPFAQGIVLTTGDAKNAEGPEQGILSDGSFAWPGDNDLENAIGLGTNATNNATFIQFDFVPLADNISFSFIFASEEYGGFQCTFTDAFAFLLTDNNTGVTTNLAIVPGTTDVVSVLNVRDNLFNAGCSSVNPEFFDSYFGGGPGSVPAIDAPIDFLGYTTRMVAESAVIPNTSYTIKLVIADDQDTLYDAAVFLEAGSFDLGGDLGDDITIAAGTAQCDGGSITLDTAVDGATHTWFKDGVEIVGETSSQITVTESGVFSVDVVFSGVCQTTDSILIEFKPSPTANDPLDLTLCNLTGVDSFILTDNNDDILGPQDPSDFVISYHLTEQDAIDNVNPLTSPYNNISNPQEIWARIAENSQECYEITSFELTLTSLDITSPLVLFDQCDDDNDGFMPFNLSDKNLEVLDGEDPASFNITYHVNQSDADTGSNPLPDGYVNISNPQTIVVRLEAINDSGCYNTAVFD